MLAMRAGFARGIRANAAVVAVGPAIAGPREISDELPLPDATVFD
jgi:hypothetical protein